MMPRVRSRLIARPTYQMSKSLLVTLVFFIALMARLATFGDPTLHTDEEFYFLVGQKMLDGQLPYVDLWDRKPFGLFLIYAGIAWISRSVVAYQIVATISVGLTAYLLTQILAHRVNQMTQLGVAFLYIAVLPWLGGFGGQTPVFYNPMIAGAALLVVRALPELESGKVGRSVYVAIALCGVALTIKQTVVVESAFFGLFSIYMAWRNGLPPKRIPVHLFSFAAIGILPMASVATFYLVYGHWAEFYQAMVDSNLSKGAAPTGWKLRQASVLVFPLAIPLSLASAGLSIMRQDAVRTFLFFWLMSAIAALFLVPNFYWHYGLPLLLPICACTAFAMDRWRMLLPAVTAIGLFGLWLTQAFNLEFHRRSAVHFEYTVQQAKAHAPRGTLLVYDGPVYLYAATELKPLSKVVFPSHFSETLESGTTGRSSVTELRETLRKKPGAVLFDPRVAFYRDNPITRAMVLDYVARHCRLVSNHIYFESWSIRPTSLYGDCER
jgi:hypothetical protein